MASLLGASQRMSIPFVTYQGTLLGILRWYTYQMPVASRRVHMSVPFGSRVMPRGEIRALKVSGEPLIIVERLHCWLCHEVAHSSCRNACMYVPVCELAFWLDMAHWECVCRRIMYGYT